MTRARIAAWTTCVALAAAHAHAADPPWWHNLYASPGVVWSWAKSPDTASGAGFELTAGYTHFLTSLGGPREDAALNFLLSPHVAMLYRNQPYDAHPGRFVRQTVGVQGGIGMVGLEVGYTWRDEFLTFAERKGLHLSPYLSLGALYCGPQWTIAGGQPEFSFNFGLKLPLPMALWVAIVNSDLWRLFR